MASIQLSLTLDETNLVLEALGQLPYVRVYGLINKLQQQATLSLKEHAQSENGINGNTNGILKNPQLESAGDAQ
jgi:hypothetical protein